MRRLFLVVSVMLAALVAGPAVSAGADPATSVTLKASPKTVTYGRAVAFSGQVSPPSADQVVDVVDAHGDVLAETRTAPDGTYATRARPDRNMNVHAQWGTTSSDPVSVFVRPRLTAKRGEVHLFQETKVTGRVVPGRGGSHVDVTLWTNGKPVARTMPMVRRDGTFSTAIEVTDYGTHSFVVRYQDWQHSPVSWRSTPAKTSMPPRVQQGSSGPTVVLLEHRLAELHYRVYAQDQSFDYHDTDSVLAFHKVQGMERNGVVDEATWRALAHPKTPRIVGPKKGTHWEVDLTKQVLYLVTDGVPVAIMHISSGKPSTPTRPGWFHVWTKQAGTNDKGMYYSSFFDGNRALHGYPEVPPYAASHGCVRIPFWNALYVYNRAPYGRLVIVHW